MISTLRAEGTTPVAGFLSPENWFNPRDEKTMKEQYARFAWQAAGEALRWDFATTAGWTDIHLKAAVPECAGLSLMVSGERSAPGLGLRVVIKDADAAEFVAPGFAVTATPETHLLPFAGFVKAPWYRGEATKPRFPLTGAKFVLDSIPNGQPGTLVLRGLAAVRGRVTEREVRGYGGPPWPTPFLAIEDPQAVPLGRDAASGSVLLACKGTVGSRQVLSTVPVVPHEILTALMDDAGVCRYVASPDVVVRADSSLIALHTKVGGKYALRLPRPAAVTDALTGERVGQGRQVAVELPPCSTRLLAVGAGR